MEVIQTLLTNNLWSLLFVALGVGLLFVLWKNRNSVKEAIYDIMHKMPKGDSQQGRIPKPVLQRVAESTHKSGGQEDQHTE